MIDFDVSISVKASRERRIIALFGVPHRIQPIVLLMMLSLTVSHTAASSACCQSVTRNYATFGCLQGHHCIYRKTQPRPLDLYLLMVLWGLVKATVPDHLHWSWDCTQVAHLAVGNSSQWVRRSRIHVCIPQWIVWEYRMEYGWVSCSYDTNRALHTQSILYQIKSGSGQLIYIQFRHRCWSTAQWST